MVLILLIVEFHCNYLGLLPHKTLRVLKMSVEEFHKKFVLAPADKTANNAVVVWKKCITVKLSRMDEPQASANHNGRWLITNNWGIKYKTMFN